MFEARSERPGASAFAVQGLAQESHSVLVTAAGRH